MRRFAEAPPVASGTVLWVAGAAILINTATALLFLGGREHDLNIRSAYLHMAGDAAVSLGVLIAAVPRLVSDVLGIADRLEQGEFLLAGHDWGGVVAWACAMANGGAFAAWRF
jgi:Co/Zn/Cd efflux system component